MRQKDRPFTLEENGVDLEMGQIHVKEVQLKRAVEKKLKGTSGIPGV